MSDRCVKPGQLWAYSRAHGQFRVDIVLSVADCRALWQVLACSNTRYMVGMRYEATAIIEHMYLGDSTRGPWQLLSDVP